MVASSKNPRAPNPSTDPSHPLYLHPSDTPGTLLVSVPFSRIGYEEQREGMIISLSAKNKLQLINGSLPKHDLNSTLYLFWRRCNNMVKAWIMNAFSKDISKTVLYYKTAKEAWDNLEERYDVTNASQYYGLQRDITSTTQGSSDIASYFTRIKGLLDELASFSFGRPCTCGAMHEFVEGQQLMQFLSELNEVYSTVMSNILMMSPIPTIGKAYSMLIRDEKQREIHSDIPSFSNDSASFIVNSSHYFHGSTSGSGKSTNTPNQYYSSNSASTHPNNYFYGSTSGSRFITGHNNNQRKFHSKINFDQHKFTLLCKYYKKSSHVVDKCYKLHGFPPNCKFTKNRKSVNCVQVDPYLDNPQSSDQHFVETTTHGFFKDQYAHLMSLFNQAHISPQSSFSARTANFAGLANSTVFNRDSSIACLASKIDFTSWILDSGVTNHMTPHKCLLHVITPLMFPTLVTLQIDTRLK